MIAGEGMRGTAGTSETPPDAEPASFPSPATMISSAPIEDEPSLIEQEPLPNRAAAAAAPGSAAAPVSVGEFWARVLRGQDVPPVLRAVMTNLQPVSIDLEVGRIVLAGAGRYAESGRVRLSQIAEACRRELGRPAEVLIQNLDQGEGDGPADSAIDPSAAAVPGPGETAEGPVEAAADGNRPVAPATVSVATPPMMPSQHPLVKEAMELFGARIVDVQYRRPSA